MNYYRPPEQQRLQDEKVVLENPSFYGRMKNRAKNAAYSVGRGVKSVGSYAYNQIPGRNGNFNAFTQTGSRSAYDVASNPYGSGYNDNRFKNQVDAARALGSVASGFFDMFKGGRGRTRKIKRKLRKTKTKKSRKRRVTRKRK
jgi:hypothetical protein